MMNYQILKNPYTQVDSIRRDDANGMTTVIPLDPSNTDYQNFKYQINHDKAQLEDADGVLMTPEQAKAYVATLP